MWDGLAQLIEIVVVLALSLVGVDYAGGGESDDAREEAAVERLIRPAAYNPIPAGDGCEVDLDAPVATPMLITVRSGEIVS